MAVHADGGKFYWSQKGGDSAGEGGIFRANIAMPTGQTAATRQDIELVFDGLPEPIDLAIDPARHTLYWTDRGDAPLGNTVNRAPLDAPAGQRQPPQTVVSHLVERMRVALDLENARMFFTDLGGTVYCANLDGSNKRVLLAAQGNLTGIGHAELPAGHEAEETATGPAYESAA